jgi:hypothetical protein
MGVAPGRIQSGNGGMTLLLAIIGHLVGDYLLQNDWMAINKKKRLLPLCVHCVLWTVSVLVITWAHGKGWPGAVTPILFFTHFVQDGFNVVPAWMDFIGQKEFRTGPCAPWSTIVVDNVWHIVTLFLIWCIFAV